jgi:hypothetical protein
MAGHQRLLIAAITLLGGFLIVLGISIHDGQAKTIAIGVGASVVAVAAVQALIVLGGGEPSEKSVRDLVKRVESAAGALEAQLVAKTAGDDLPSWFAELGIRRIYATRSAVNGQSDWHKLAAGANQIDLMGLTMWDEWLQHPPLVEALRSAARRAGGSVRIIVLAVGAGKDPDAEMMRGRDFSVYVRARQEGELKAKLLWDYLDEAHDVLDRLRRELRTANFEVQEMRTKTYPHALIIRIDDYMMVAPYLSSVPGAQSFAMELGKGPLFDLYLDEFEQAFRIERDESQNRS